MGSTFERESQPTNGKKDGKLRQIRALLAKASDPGCTEAERDALNAKAAELMANHGIDRARAFAADANGDQMTLSPYCFYDETHAAQATLMYRIAEAVGCKALLTPSEADPDFESTGLTVIGYQSDVDRAETYFESLYLQMVQAAIKFPRNGRPSFMRGFASEVGDRIQAAENMARQDEAPAGSSTALVLQSRSVAVIEALHKEFPTISRGRSVSRNVDGYNAGRAAGKAASLGGTAVGSSRQAIAS